MKRIGAQYVYISPEIQIKKGVLEIADNGLIQNIFSLENMPVETSNTEFYNGILSPAFISISQNKKTTRNFFVVNTNKALNFPTTEANLIFDFENSSLSDISQALWLIQEKLAHQNIFDIINACSYFRAQLVNENTAGIKIGNHTEIWLFENVDLINKKILPQTSIRIV